VEPYVFGNETYRDRAKLEAIVVRNAKLRYHGRAEPAVLEGWAREAVAGLWSDDLRVARFIPALALRDVGARVVEAERGGPIRAIVAAISVDAA
jgi:hypothetical protein